MFLGASGSYADGWITSIREYPSFSLAQTQWHPTDRQIPQNPCAVALSSFGPVRAAFSHTYVKKTELIVLYEAEFDIDHVVREPVPSVQRLSSPDLSGLTSLLSTNTAKKIPTTQIAMVSAYVFSAMLSRLFWQSSAAISHFTPLFVCLSALSLPYSTKLSAFEDFVLLQSMKTGQRMINTGQAEEHWRALSSLFS